MTTGHLSQFRVYSRRSWALRTLGGPPPQRSGEKAKQGSPEEEHIREYAARKVEHMKLDDDVPIGRMEKP
jgi:hypothetical protein